MVGLAVLGLLAIAGPAWAEPAGSLLIPAYAFDRGNAKTFTAEYADAGPMVAYGGEYPVVVEYDVDFPVGATYSVNVCYAAEEARPVELYLDETQLGSCCRTATGSWSTSGAKWEETCKSWINPGRHTVKLVRNGAFPHVVSLRFDSSEPFPEGWKLARPKARTLDSPPPVPKAERYAPGSVDLKALRLAIADLMGTFGAEYPGGPEYLRRLEALEAKQQGLAEADTQGRKSINDALVALRREALLANPLLDFDRLLLVKRPAGSPSLGLPMNWQSNCSLPRTGFDDSIELLSPLAEDGRLTTLYKPGGKFVGDLDLHFDAGRLLFSMPGSHNRWQVFEIRTDGTGLRELTGEQPDVDSYDACYLPDGRIIFMSTACFIGVPCVYGSSHVAVLYVMDAEGKNIRQLCFDQEHDWCPAMMNNGRVLYTRWEYTDTPHSNTRLLFSMNPDGTGQMEYYGSNSYWPNSIFYARPVPRHPTKVVGVVGGHHDNPRMGELVIFDPAQGRYEASGAVQRIPGRGQRVEAIIADGLTLGSWPKFLHPYPLSEKYFLVACKPTSRSLWGIYLVDVFDNMVLVKEEPDYALLEPVPLRKTPRPPVVPDKVDLSSKDALVYLPDVYAGKGLRGIPRGKVKSLRLFTYHFSYQGMGGLIGTIGIDGPWDMKRVLGTVPVCADGSAKFRIPANTPISIQPLDEEGKAVQLMRSWMTAMPGEVVQCAGCHEPQNTAPLTRQTIAHTRPAAEIEPWYGPVRGFSYPREVQPVVDKYCLACHNGRAQPDGKPIADLRGDVKLSDWRQVMPGNGGARAGKFSVGYAELHRFVRRPGIESDYHMLEPMEFHADTTELVQMLKKGHYNVRLDAEAWDRLITWIDLNTPYHGTWGEELDDPGVQRQRRRELLKLYANVDDDPEAVPQVDRRPVEPIMPEPLAEAKPQAADGASGDLPSPRSRGEGPGVRGLGTGEVAGAEHRVAGVERSSPPAKPDAVGSLRSTTATPAGWPFDAAEAKRRQAAAGPTLRQTIDLGDGVTIELVLVPAGEFVMGSPSGEVDERPLTRVRIERPFWMGKFEVTNRQFARFDPAHDSRVESKDAYQFGIHGFPMNRPEQPVVRVPWQSATAFCRWLSEKTGRRFSLPSEAQWEYACRAGTATPFSFGDLAADFSPFANLADAKLTEFASDPYTVDTPLVNPSKYDDWIPKDTRFNDGAVIPVAPGKYQPNAWGLCDVHGNVAEWTRSTYRPYPYSPADGRDDATPTGRKVVRGGSWRDRPPRCTSSFRLSYEPYQRIYNVGFRVICEAEPAVVAAKE